MLISNPMKLFLACQKFLATADGAIKDDSMYPTMEDGDLYWVRPITKGAIKKGMNVLAVAKRSWMGSNKRLVKNYIVKRVEEVKVSCVYY